MRQAMMWLLVALSTVAAASVYAADGAEDLIVPKLTVTGHALLHKPADELRMSISVVTEAADATTSLAENNSKMEKVIASLEKIDLSNSDYDTGLFTIDPLYTIRPQKADDDWEPTIRGYKVTNTLAVKTPHVKAAGKIIDAASAAGVNQIYNIAFALSDARAWREEAIATAAANARKDAHELAKALAINLDRIIDVSLDNAQTAPLYKQESAFFARSMAAAPSTPIEAGDVEVRAAVTLIYEIAH